MDNVLEALTTPISTPFTLNMQKLSIKWIMSFSSENSIYMESTKKYQNEESKQVVVVDE